MQIHKTLGDFEGGNAFFGKYSVVNDEFLRYREIVIENKLPRSIELIHDIQKVDDEVFEYKEFPETFEGIIESQVYHYHSSVDDVFDEWYKHKYHFRIRPTKAL